VFGNNHEPETLSQFVLVPANNFSQTPPNPIANDRVSNAAGSNEPCTPQGRIPSR
jgi:hypothetical protein